MISVVYCTRESNKEHTEHLIKTSGLLKTIEVIEIINNGESLTKSYNRGLKQAKNDIVVFCHDDLTIETKQWGNKLLKAFSKHPEYGVIGVAGTKFMSTSGRWWENPKKMYGRVAHTNEGKTWLSTYSEDLGQEIEETVIVDGLFFAVDKKKLKKTFNENVNGFHFYDVTFCFENYLEGVKVGVTTLVRVNHKSIGMTNDEWEKNRVQFSDTFKDNLPVSIKKTQRKGERLKVLITAMSFDDESNKSKIILDLISKLRKENHDITLCANMQGKIPMKAKQIGVKLAPIQQPPGFALGDGKWKINTQDGVMVSQPNTLYKIKEFNYDVIHTFDDEIIDHMNKIYPNSNIVNTVFSNGLVFANSNNPIVKTTIEMGNEVVLNNVVDKYFEVI